MSVDDVALRRGRRSMTMVIDPVTQRRIDVLPDRLAAPLAGWLRDRPVLAVHVGPMVTQPPHPSQ
ncbi:hypothetical protein [Pseudonocardia sp. NPDC046786]|uniref:hypothetical protein n=1 Tax=Pseudonocardia sp. NPDC046786 TaxID=3155471 RepID=UPI0033D2F5EB